MLGTAGKELCDDSLVPALSTAGTCDGITTDGLVEVYRKLNRLWGDAFDVRGYASDNMLSMEECVRKLEAGCVLNVAVNALALWDVADPMGSPVQLFRTTDLWIAVTGVRKDPEGNVQGFEIVDAGNAESYVDAAKFKRMCYGTDARKVLDPACVVIRKRDDSSDEPDGAEAVGADTGDTLRMEPEPETAESPVQVSGEDPVFHWDELFGEFLNCPEDSDEAFRLQRKIHQLTKAGGGAG